MGNELEVARISDPTSCPTHGQSALSIGGCSTVLAGALPVARIGDGCTCAGAPNSIVRGNPTVLVQSSPIARETDSLSHSAYIERGCAKVLVGAPATDADGNLLVLPPECAYLSHTINDADKGWDSDPAKDKRPQKGLDRWRRPYELGPGRPVTYTDRNTGQPTQGVAHTVEIEGQNVEVVVPPSGTNPPAGKTVPTADQVAKSLSILPDETLDSLDTVVVTNTPKGDVPADHANGTIYQYPRGDDPNKKSHDQPNLDWRMLHEGSHAYDRAHMGAEREAEWRAAMDADARHPTKYAREGGQIEDYAESVVMYALVRGTPCEAYGAEDVPRPLRRPRCVARWTLPMSATLRLAWAAAFSCAAGCSDRSSSAPASSASASATSPDWDPPCQPADCGPMGWRRCTELDSGHMWPGEIVVIPAEPALAFGDANGDGVEDFIAGCTDAPDTTKSVLDVCAFDGATFAMIWRTGPFVDSPGLDVAHTGWIGKHVFAVRPSGAVLVLDAASGKDLFRTQVSGRPARVCSVSVSAAVVEMQNGPREQITVHADRVEVGPAPQDVTCLARSDMPTGRAAVDLQIEPGEPGAWNLRGTSPGASSPGQSIQPTWVRPFPEPHPDSRVPDPRSDVVVGAGWGAVAYLSRDYTQSGLAVALDSGKELWRSELSFWRIKASPTRLYLLDYPRVEIRDGMTGKVLGCICRNESGSTYPRTVPRQEIAP